MGGTRVAEWDLYTIFTSIADRGLDSSLATTSPAVGRTDPVGIAESAIIIKPRTTLLLQFNEVTTVAVDFGFQLLGGVIEKTGAGDGLNP